MENRLSLKLDSTGDLDFANNELKMIDGREELAQCVRVLLSVNVNEWFLNNEFGLRYADIRGKRKPTETIQLALREAILQEDRVSQVYIEDVEINNRTRQASFKIYFTDLNGNEFDLMEVVNL